MADEWLPWLAKSARHSSVCRVAGGTPLIFAGPADGGDAGDTRTQVKMIFERLGSVVFETGSSDRHSVKAS